MRVLESYTIPVSLVQGQIVQVVACNTCVRTQPLVVVAEEKHTEDNYTLKEIIAEKGWEMYEGKPECPLCVQDRKDDLALDEQQTAEQTEYYRQELNALAAEGVRACNKRAA